MRFFLITNFKVSDIQPSDGVISCIDYKSHRVWFTSPYTDISHIFETYQYDIIIYCLRYSELKNIWEQDDKKKHVIVIKENAQIQDILYELNTDMNLFTQAHIVSSVNELAVELKTIINSY
jgi:hypothetical protein